MRNKSLPIKKEVKKIFFVTYDNETVVYDSNEQRLVSVPTEQEAIEYINDQENT